MGNVIAPDSSQTEELKLQYQVACEKAALAITQADVFLFAAGAGFSSDSGLPIFRDAAKVPAYQERNISYRELAVPSWFTNDPPLAYGFVGNMFNSYRNTHPHPGYGIIKKWKDTYFAKVPEKRSQ